MSICGTCAHRADCDFRKAIRSTNFGKLAACAQYKRRSPRKNHRLIMAETVGRELEHLEFVHHINGVHSDNRIDNLFLCSPSEHIRIHRMMRKGASRADALIKIINERLVRSRLGSRIERAALLDVSDESQTD